MENFIGKAEVLMEALPYFQRFYGKTFVYLGEITPALRSAFDQIAESRDVVLYSEREIPFARWTISVCRGFRGFANPAPANVYGLF